MARLLQISLLLLLTVIFSTRGNAQKFGFSSDLRSAPDRITTFCVPGNDQNIQLLNTEGISIKYTTGNWIFISATPSWVHAKMDSGQLSDFFFEFAPPALMSDSARAHHFVNE